MHLGCRETIEHRIIGRMHRNQLTLQMGRQLGDLDPAVCQHAAQIIAVGLAGRGGLEIDERGLPAGNLYAPESKIGGPGGNVLQAIKRRFIAHKLSQENRRAFDGSHSVLSLYWPVNRDSGV